MSDFEESLRSTLSADLIGSGGSAFTSIVSKSMLRSRRADLVMRMMLISALMTVVAIAAAATGQLATLVAPALSGHGAAILLLLGVATCVLVLMIAWLLADVV